jgi:hypothetical protein
LPEGEIIMLLHALHFDAGVFPPEINYSSGTTVNTTQKRTGAYSMRIDWATSDYYYYSRLALATGLSEFYLQFGLFLNASPSGNYPTKLVRWEGPTGTVLGGLAVNNTTGKI